VRAEALAGQTAREKLLREKVEGEKPGVELTPREEILGKLQALHPDTSREHLEMYLDVMELDQERFVEYGVKLGLDNPEQRAETYFKWQKEKTRQEIVGRARKQEAATMKVNGRPNYGSGLGADMADAVERGGLYGESVEDVRVALDEKYGVRLENRNSTDMDKVHREASALLRMADSNPVLAQTLQEHVAGLAYTDNPGRTAAAHYDPVTRIIHIHPADFDLPGSALVHEAGHAAEAYAPDLGREGLEFGEPMGRAVSMYARGNYSEDYAEMYGMLVSQWEAGAIKGWVPRKYQYMLDNVPGLAGWLGE